MFLGAPQSVVVAAAAFVLSCRCSWFPKQRYYPLLLTLVFLFSLLPPLSFSREMRPSYPNKRPRFPDQQQQRRGGRGYHHGPPGGRRGREGRGGGGRGRGGPRRPPAGSVVDTSRIPERGTAGPNTLSVAILGCCHGEIGAVYNRIENHQIETGRNVDLLVCCGDFQSLRVWEDFHSLAVPPKYRNALGSFLPYYVGEKQAPVPTIVIGGNHEASQALQELYYGGWLAPQIYYLGAAGVVRYRGLRIGGLGGIYKDYSYRKPHWERPPYNPSNSLRSVYHVRQVDVARLLSLSVPIDKIKAEKSTSTAGEQLQQLRRRLDIMLSHDWPRGIEHHGDLDGLLRKKPFFREDIQKNELGSPAGNEILLQLKPRHWFAAHLHVQFEATVNHDKDGAKTADAESASPIQLTPSQVITASQSPKPAPASQAEDSLATEEAAGQKEPETTNFFAAESRDPCGPPDLTEQMTKFLALDKCLPRKPYLSIIHVPVDGGVATLGEAEAKLEYDLEWLTILRKTHEWTCTDTGATPVAVSEDELEETMKRVGSCTIPENFSPNTRTLLTSASTERIPHPLPPPLPQQGNPQTDAFLEMLGLQHCSSGLTVPWRAGVPLAAAEVDPNSIDIESDPEVEEDPNEIDLDEDDGDNDVDE